MSKIKLIGIASSQEDQELGLQFIKEIDDMSGMLFSFSSPRILNFWMKNTYIPLDIAFLDKEGIVIKTEKMVPLSLRTISSGKPCNMALEVPLGLLDKIGVGIGDKLSIDTKNMTIQLSEDE